MAQGSGAGCGIEQEWDSGFGSVFWYRLRNRAGVGLRVWLSVLVSAVEQSRSGTQGLAQGFGVGCGIEQEWDSGFDSDLRVLV